ncbi:MAG TPA: hypothetical protein PK926_03655 [Spirochaetota bacterium]|nr:hypothetical protein [Spirochaetota bacterium]HPI89503.1 hypothetical protein [Spirochaetota bacterium]HPR47091.1 hypothetical protein [Spirochaetota bacterium]
MEKDCFDSVELYCRKLGHYVTFRYCRTLAQGMPCSGIYDCAFEKIPVREYMAEHYSDEEIAAILAPPQPKMASIIELIQQAKKNRA